MLYISILYIYNQYKQVIIIQIHNRFDKSLIIIVAINA